MKAIITKYLGPTNTKPSRIKAFDEDGNQLILSTSQLSGNIEDIHKQAAIALSEKMGWGSNLVGGSISTGYAWVYV